jgi:hypothetical protein
MKILHRWQKGGCDLRNVAISIHRYRFGHLNKLAAYRKLRRV